MATAAVSLEQCTAQLASIAGAEHAQVRGESIVVAPANAAQIGEILRYADQNRLIVTPTGGGTKLAWGNPVPANILLSMERMTAVREHSWQDMTCTVEAGCTWDAMESALARHRQVVALDPLWPARATVGGIAATNDSGALRLKYGSLRDLILGMTVVLADGTIARTGGKVVKNVAGYDLHKLMTGSFGTLGVIAEVNFRLHPIEQHACTWTIAGDTEALHSVLMRLLNSTMQISAMQLRGLHLSGADRLDIRFAASPGCLQTQREQLQAVADRLEITAAEESVWQTREQLFADAAGRDGLIFKATMLPSQIAAVHSKLADCGAESACVTQASGIMTAAVFDHHLGCESLVQELRSMLRASGGSVVVLRQPAALRPQLDVWGCDSNALPLMREIKRQFDPNRILNPGRFVGDI